MESQDIRTPSWGAPAARSTPRSDQAQNVNRQNFSRGGQSFHNQSPGTPNYQGQRLSPYHKDHRGRGGTFQNGRQNSDSSNVQSPRQNFSPQNPFASQACSFSNDNPYQTKGQPFSPNNPFQRNSQNNSPRFQQSQFQASPGPHTPGMSNRSFSPRTPNTPFQTPSPRDSSHFRGHSNSSQHFHRRNSSMSNPGDSDNIRDYISSNMLEDPWRDLPPRPMLQLQ